MLRGTFLSGIGFVGLNAVFGNPVFANCEKNKFLAYDRRLELKMRALDGPDFALSDYHGLAVWLNIFATWCPPCYEEQPLVVDLAKQYYIDGLRVIGIDYKESDNAVRHYREKYGITYPIAMDASGGFSGEMEGNDGRISLPSQLFISGGGFLHCYARGNLRRDEMVAYVEDLLSTPFSSIPTPYAEPQATPKPAALPTVSPTPLLTGTP